MKIPKNPFLLNGYYSADYFCNRESKLAALNNHLHNERNVVLFSWRRMGKSALIRRFLSEKEQSGKFEMLYIDLLASRSIKQAIEMLIEAVYQKFGNTSDSLSSSFSKLIASLGVSMSFDPLSGLPSFSMGLNQKINHQESLSSIGKFLSSREKQVILAIDEFQQISHYAEENGEAVFRSFMQEFPTLRFIYSGSHRKIMTAMFSESNRPFYKSCCLLSLDPISKDHYFPFIQNHFKEGGKDIEYELMEEIYNWCRGQTYSIQLLCNRLYGSNIPLNKEGLQIVIEDIMEEESPVFSNYFHLLPKMQWQVLKAIAKEEKVANPQAKEFLQRHNLGAASSVSTAIKSLSDKEVLVWEEGVYFVHDLIFSRWLQTRN